MENKSWIERNLMPLLACAIVATWIACIVWDFPGTASATNIVMILVGYYWGSSNGSQKKDETIKNLKSNDTP